MRIVSREDVEALGLAPATLTEALAAAFLAAREGRLLGRPKTSILPPDGAFYITAVACWPEAGLGLFHNIMGTAATNVPPGAPHYTTRQLVARYRDAVPIALIDGTFTSTMLPACVTALTARRLARPGSRIAAFIGAGVQASVNFATLKAEFPLDEVRIVSRTLRSAETFAAKVRAAGCRTVVQPEARAAVEGADIVVTSVPGRPDNRAFLDPAWVSSGGFVSAVDLGRSWLPGFERFDRIVTDDREQAVIQHREGRMSFGGPFDTEIPELIAGARPDRTSAQERVVVIHPGNVVGIFGITRLVLQRMGIAG